MNHGPLKALIVDDQEGIRFLLEIILKDEGYNVLMAKNGLEGVEKCGSFEPDLVFMDIRMPVMDGIEAAKEIRKFNQEVPIVVMTAYSEKKAIDEAHSCNISEYVSKPFDVLDIKRIVDKYTLQSLNNKKYHNCG